MDKIVLKNRRLGVRVFLSGEYQNGEAGRLYWVGNVLYSNGYQVARKLSEEVVAISVRPADRFVANDRALVESWAITSLRVYDVAEDALSNKLRAHEQSDELVRKAGRARLMYRKQWLRMQAGRVLLEFNDYLAALPADEQIAKHFPNWEIPNLYGAL